mmetsp:Transcript_12892/g.24210  ORF Transcript_12892/g.24210 Transcript_12892/m.24210 type:complete len:518 (+) Transcript_12892:68-1621(+)|eukprot:CAMPEP_0176479334 /NCGR_PEP_ID=MMETSP0200_2-20121128/1685_1 /TAXON_ID=947934 /ORGANISM="Chaetoceros sp., Strain GSL56" /LENGTH=517 /DNA_ID=CAMNT_0017875373 /DNA_START=33 /DNA_END=1586 /DNA_ORIENTATION=-
MSSSYHSNLSSIILDSSPASHSPASCPDASDEQQLRHHHVEKNAEELEHETSTGAAKQAYHASGNSKMMLCVLCIGLMSDSGDPIMDISREPWNSIRPKSDIKPKGKDLVNEVLRHADAFQLTPAPRPNGWNTQKLMHWLNRNPVTQSRDIKFLCDEVSRVHEILVLAKKEEEEEESKMQQMLSWRDKVPYLRMIHCILEDDVKVAYLKRNDPVSRTQLDARNLVEKRPLNVYELIADKWNSPFFNSKTEVSECHLHYMVSIDCSYSQVKDLAPATPQKVRDKLTEMRTSLIRIIDNWEHSGQGDGGNDYNFDDEDGVEIRDGYEVNNEQEKQFGELKDHSRRALDSRSSFLQKRPSYLLYFWEMIDKHDLLKTTVNRRLNEGTGALDGSVGSVPTVAVQSASKNKRKTNGTPESLDGSFYDGGSDITSVHDDFSTSMKSLEKSLADDRLSRLSLSIRERINHLNDERRKYSTGCCSQMQAIGANNSAMASFYADEQKAIEEEINTNKDELEELSHK